MSLSIYILSFILYYHDSSGYFDPIDVADELSVFPMRLAQDAGLANSTPASIVATYDLSCPLCPFGSVHNLDKTDVGARVAIQLQHFIELRTRSSDIVFEGPRAVEVTSSPAAQAQASANTYSVTVIFEGGAVTPPLLKGTRNCSLCCDGSGTQGDFSASSDGEVFVNGTIPGRQYNYTALSCLVLTILPLLFIHSGTCG